jgi:hypothetical protein
LEKNYVHFARLLNSTERHITFYGTVCTEHTKKGKAVPLQAWRGPEGSRKLRFPDYMTMAQDGGKVVSPTHRPPLPPRNTPGTHFCCRPGSSVGIATDLRAGLSGDRIPVGVRFSAPVQTCPGAHPSSCTMGTCSFTGVNCGRGVLLTTHPISSADVMEE